MAKSVSQLLREAVAALEREENNTNSVQQVSNPRPSAVPQPQPESRASSVARETVQREVSRLFSPYPQSSSLSSGMRRRQALIKPYTKKTYTHKFFCLSGRRDCKVPQLWEKMDLECSGLGEKKIVFPDKHCTSEEFKSTLLMEFPKLKDGGGFELLRPYGATRTKTLQVVPCPSEGYTPHYLQDTIGIHAAIVYVRPLQKDLDMCIYCEETFSHAEIQDHVDKCILSAKEKSVERGENSRGQNCYRQEIIDLEDSDKVLEETCSSRQENDEQVTERSHSSREQRHDLAFEGTSSRRLDSGDLKFSSEDTEDWRTETDLNRAAYIFRRFVLQEVEDQPDLVAKMDLRKSPEEREREILTFYKNSMTNWAHPLCVLLGGDSAFGDGVKRHFLSFVMSRVQYGFGLNFENCGKTLFFNGQEDHLVPSTSRLLLDSDLFRVIGRMIGHSFLHGGPLLTGLSRSLFNLLIGQKDEIAVVELEDCPDTDVTDIVLLLQGSGNLTEDELDQVNNLAINWDLPPVNENNRKWLAQSILFHAVIGRREKQIRQMRLGLKDTGVLHMVRERPALIDVLFPRASAQMIEPEMVLDRIIWPTVDSDDEDYGGCSLEDTFKITGFFRQYIENGTPEELMQLIQFWVGWGILPQNLYVEVSSDVAMPTASTCRETIKLPAKYSTYESFRKDLKAAVSTIESGFGLV
ncbi:uncharacterized protein LOC120476763 [Pimephales promelas]|uniref:uncharacterized protein LOC120476763 n=1 Tax=Pimephales promelas TaxID=90988 RepID=UPI001955A67B|nr:uncharacterized protein LOC120476763 [Pimephales promelas]